MIPPELFTFGGIRIGNPIHPDLCSDLFRLAVGFMIEAADATRDDKVIGGRRRTYLQQQLGH